MVVKEIMRRLFRLRPKARPEAKARLIAMIPRRGDGAPVTAGLDAILVILERHQISPGEVRWFERAIESEAARAAGGNNDDEEI